MHTVGHTLSVIQPQDIFCHIKRLAASVDLKTSHHFLLRFFNKMKWVLMKGSHFVICIGMRSPFQTSPKLGCGWKLHSVLYFGVLFMPHSHPLSFLSHLVIFPQQHSVSFLFDVQRMNKAVCNIYIRVSCLDMPRMKSRHQTAKTF